MNPDFETGTAPWAGYAPGASVVDLPVTQVSSDVPGAGMAGRLCRPATTPQYMSFIHSRLYPPPAVGRGYSLSAWVRRAPVNADAGAFTLSIALRSRNDAGTEILQQKHPYAFPNLDVEWRKVETTYPTVGTGSGIATFDLFLPVDAPVPPGFCLDVDDVCLVLTP